MPRSRNHTSALALFLVLPLVQGASLLGCSVETEGIFGDVTGPNTGASTSSTSTGAGGQGTGGQGTGGQISGAGGGVVGPEDCLDGVDNDGDKAIDCADTDCAAGFTCEAAPPSGWDYAWTDPSGAPLPCADGTTAETFFTGPAGPAECVACSCGALAGASCSNPGLSCFAGSTTCGGNAQDWTPEFAAGACQKPTNQLGFANSLSCRLSGQATVQAPGNCPPSAADFTNKETWQGKLDACAVQSGGGCAAGSACVPKTNTPTQSLCIRRTGNDTCPAGFTTTIQAFTGGTDTRSCTDCACEPATTCAGGIYTFFDNNNCQPPGAGNSANIAVDNATCRNVSGQLDVGSWSVEANPATPTGNCTPKGGQPVGEVATQGAVTFCCK